MSDKIVSIGSGFSLAFVTSLTWAKLLDSFILGVVGAFGGLVVHLIYRFIKNKWFKSKYNGKS